MTSQRCTDHVFLMSISPGLLLDICRHATRVQCLNILLVNHLDVCGCLKQVQYLGVRLGPLLDTVHTICQKFTTTVKHVQLTSRHIWAQKNRRKSFANTLEITEVPIRMDGLQINSHTHTELCGKEV